MTTIAKSDTPSNVRMKSYNTILLFTIAVVASVNADAIAVTRQFGSEPLDDVIVAAQEVKKCTDLTSAELAVMMLVPSWWETVGGSTAVTPSPMTLSRADFGSKNINLYSEASYAGDERAFSHPGIGLWQLDDSGLLGQPYAAYQRIDTSNSSIVVAGGNS